MSTNKKDGGPPDWVGVGIALAVFIGAAVGLWIVRADWTAWSAGLLQAAAAGAFGAFLVLAALGINRRRAADESARTRRDDLAALRRQMADDVTARLGDFIRGQVVARLRAAQTPEERQPILDEMMAADLLRGLDLTGGNLQRARLPEANLSAANLTEASLPAANLRRANLAGAVLHRADFQGADLSDADLQGANLHRANLRGANLQGANLAGAGFVTDRQLAQALKLWRATLPDGSRYDGRFNLEADIQDARGLGVNSYDPALLARWYAYPGQPYDGRALARWMRGDDTPPGGSE